jgi:hypothetical protein
MVIKPSRKRLARHEARMGYMRNAYNNFVARPEGKRPLGRPRCGWDYNIRMYLRKWGFGLCTGSV